MQALVIADIGEAQLGNATLCTIAAASELGVPVHVLTAGHGVDAIADQVREVKGVDQVRVADSVALQHPLPELLAPVVCNLARDYGYILFPATTFGKNLAPRVAALLDVQMLSDVTVIISADTFQRPIYAGNAVATIQMLDGIKVLTIRSTAFEPAEVTGGSASVSEVSVVATGASRCRFLGHQLTASDRPSLASARVVVAGGRGMQSRENFGLLETLADALGAALGATRAAVDAGFVPNDLQVGQTGKIVSPDLYVAVGISGAIQHLAGMKDSQVIVAINKDETAPIFSVADYGIVGDLFEIVPALCAELRGESLR